MDNSPDTLDWKKVFKKFLNGQEVFEENKKCLRESFQRASSEVNLKTKEKLQENINSYSFFPNSSSNNSNNFSGGIGMDSPSLHERNLIKIPACEFNTNKVQEAKSTKQNCNFSKSDKSNQVPEWNKVFKTILGKNSSVPALEEQKIAFDAIKKQENSQKHVASVNTRSASRKKLYKVPKSKDPEEEKVKELFAVSRMFKLEYHNLNEFDGTGVDIFKCDKKSFSKSSVKYHRNPEFADKAPKNESDFELFVPLEGFVAKFKPYTTADLVASPSVAFTEPAWDDDLLI